MFTGDEEYIPARRFNGLVYNAWGTAKTLEEANRYKKFIQGMQSSGLPPKVRIVKYHNGYIIYRNIWGKMER